MTRWGLAVTECATPYPPPAPPFTGAYTAFAQVFPDLRIQHRAAAGLLGQETRALAALAALLPEDADNAPFGGAAAFRLARPSRPAGPPTPLRTRVSCCLYYTVRPGEPCAGCPRACH
ncbi:(2Fe-2S)-binding protein [Kitasatospora sp. NBC_01266]|uniref:(2Fe-2S)-binding protein n=1 Tax=Kitasatospora sp. NBC_01266 TaxID=2903572 RepID=UPI002E331CAA|nr:(2Fe-2S)-binding protein [Kitasatospora sp. NBC_01266]